jgi:ATP-binding cassette, subfamily B, bacterial
MNTSLAAYLAQLQPVAPRVTPPAAGASAGVSFRASLQAAGVFRHLTGLLAMHVVEIGFVMVSWVFIGSGALNGRPDRGWGAAWALCLASLVPLRMATRWVDGMVTIGVGGVLKERLLAAATRVDPDLVRRQGTGELLGALLEAEAIERPGLSGGLQGVLAAIELLAMPVVLTFGAAAHLEIAVLLAWIALTLVLIVVYTQRRGTWTTQRLALTHQFVEGMVAHRTRVIQQEPSAWHVDEDQQLDAFHRVSARLDQATAWIAAVAPRAYTIAALMALAPAYVSSQATVEQQAITLGAVLFATDAFGRLMAGLTAAAAGWNAWCHVKPLFETATPAPHSAQVDVDLPAAEDTVLRAEDVRFTHAHRVEPVVNGCSLTIARGDFVLLEGASGSGKSTLIALLAGARRPSAGIVLSCGLDLPTLGRAAWRRRIAMAPQDHENHVLSASFGFNLLLGRPYPHTRDDLERAREVCLELGLGPLLERMPAGLDQIVGQAGWPLSHGERSRLFIARALLQSAELVVLDESLATLDPETLRQCQACLFRRAKALLLVAHP